MRGQLLTLGSLLATLSLSACAAEPPPRGGRLVHLDFADGTTSISHGDEDDAASHVSRLCGPTTFARWEAPDECGDRDTCRAAVLEHVRAYFEAYDVRFTLERPDGDEPFSTVVIAPPAAACSYGRRGVAHGDCSDANPANVGFVFDCYASAASCAVLVAHETAHGFGLVHSLDPTDVMTPGPEDPSLRFRASSSLTTDNECGVSRQSSHEALLAVLGPSPRARSEPRSAQLEERFTR